RRGSRTIFLVGFALFTLASTLCSLAPSLLVLQIARAFQGLGAALLVPNSLALLNTIYTGARKRAQAIGIWAAVASIGALSAPLSGITLERKDNQPSDASLGTVSRENVLCHQCRRRVPDLYVYWLPVCHESVPARGETLFAISDGSGTASCIWLCPPGGIAL